MLTDVIERLSAAKLSAGQLEFFLRIAAVLGSDWMLSSIDVGDQVYPSVTFNLRTRTEVGELVVRYTDLLENPDFDHR